MKLFFLLIPFLFQIATAFGQSDLNLQKSNKWTAGLIVISEQNQKYGTGLNGYEYEFNPDFLSGFILKRHFKNFSLRSGIEFKKRIIKEIPLENWRDYPTVIGTGNDGMLRLGIEKGIVYKTRYKPYLALDLVGYKSNYNVISTGGFSGGTSRDTGKTIGFGAIPTAGFEFLITNRFSIALESRVRLIYYKTDHTSEDLEDPAPLFKATDSFFLSNFNRIGVLTVNISF